MKKNLAIGLLLSILLPGAPAWSDPVPGSLDVHWSQGAEDCDKASIAPIQVHRYEAQTFILRQSFCADFEAPLLYLLIGDEEALLIDTGAVPDSAQMPLVKTVMDLLPGKGNGNGKIPLLVLTALPTHSSKQCPESWSYRRKSKTCAPRSTCRNGRTASLTSNSAVARSISSRRLAINLRT
jgi:hypothetical protein